MTEQRWLVIKADRTCRITRRRPRLATDEVVVLINLEFPDAWGKHIDTVDLQVPGTPELVP